MRIPEAGRASETGEDIPALVASWKHRSTGAFTQVVSRIVVIGRKTVHKLESVVSRTLVRCVDAAFGKLQWPAES